MDGAEWDNHMDVGADWTRPQLPKKLEKGTDSAFWRTLLRKLAHFDFQAH